jgi:alpha-glucoside transport system permease protein
MQQHRNQIASHLGRSHLGRGPCALWLFPTVGLLRVVLPHRRPDRQPPAGGRRCSRQEQASVRSRIETRVAAEGFRWRANSWFTGNLFEATASVRRHDQPLGHQSSRAIDAYEPGEVADLGDGETITVAERRLPPLGNDDQLPGAASGSSPRPTTPPEFTLDNYRARAVRSDATGRAWPRPSSTR